jgi:hypothetical protein
MSGCQQIARFAELNYGHVDSKKKNGHVVLGPHQGLQNQDFGPHHCLQNQDFGPHQVLAWFASH